MTIDSAYFPEEKNIHSGTVYPFSFETIGDTAMDVWYRQTVAGEIVWTQVDPGDYTGEYDYREPIHARGELTFTVPWTDDRILSIERSTPIDQTINFVAKSAFPAERYEYSADKITMILQELEGRKCDCPLGPEGSPSTGGCIPVTIETGPLDAMGEEEEDVVFTVVAAGTEVYAYQWDFDGTPIPGATLDTLTVTIAIGFIGPLEVGVTVTNLCGTAFDSATLTLDGYVCSAYFSELIILYGSTWLWQMNDDHILPPDRTVLVEYNSTPGALMETWGTISNQGKIAASVDLCGTDTAWQVRPTFGANSTALRIPEARLIIADGFSYSTILGRASAGDIPMRIFEAFWQYESPIAPGNFLGAYVHVDFDSATDGKIEISGFGGLQTQVFSIGETVDINTVFDLHVDVSVPATDRLKVDVYLRNALVGTLAHTGDVHQPSPTPPEANHNMVMFSNSTWVIHSQALGDSLSPAQRISLHEAFLRNFTTYTP